jgi:hypothetical protein
MGPKFAGWMAWLGVGVAVSTTLENFVWAFLRGVILGLDPRI